MGSLSGQHPICSGLSLMKKNPKIAATTRITAQVEVAKAIPSRWNMKAMSGTKTAVARGKPMVAHPNAMPFFRGNHVFIRVPGAMNPKPAPKKFIDHESHRELPQRADPAEPEHSCRRAYLSRG